MPKIVASYASKRSTGNYGNESYSASIEAEIPATNNPESVKESLRRVFALAKASVDEQFQNGAANPKPAPAVPASASRATPRNGVAPSNGRHIPATANQKKAIWAICKAMGADPKQYDIENLSVRQASEFIDQLKSQQAR